jgi:hypothetical protein
MDGLIKIRKSRLWSRAIFIFFTGREIKKSALVMLA